MYQRGNIFYADFYDAQGRRVRQSFPNASAAAKFERQGRTVAKKQKDAGEASPRSCAPKRKAQGATQRTASSRKPSSK